MATLPFRAANSDLGYDCGATPGSATPVSHPPSATVGSIAHDLSLFKQQDRYPNPFPVTAGGPEGAHWVARWYEVSCEA